MTRGVLDQFVRSKVEELLFAEEEAHAHVALVMASALELRGMSQLDLAKALGVTEARVSQILSADANITLRMLARISHALGMRLRVEMLEVKR